MSTYDLVMLAVMAGAILFGIWKGLAWQIASLGAIFISYIVAMNFRGQVASMIKADPPWDRFLAMFILFVGTSFAVWIAFGFVRRTIERMHLNSFDRQIGGVLGAVKGVILCTIVTLFAVSLLGDSTRRAICTSKSGNYIARALVQLDGLVPTEISKYIDPYIDRFNDAMDQHQNDPRSLQVGQPTFPGQPSLPAPGDPVAIQTGNQGQGFWNVPIPGQNPPSERIGQLQPAYGNQPTQYQYNASTGKWEISPSTASGRAPQPNLPPVDLPQLDWQRAAETVIEAASKFGKGKGNR